MNNCRRTTDAGRSGIRSGVLPIDQGLEIGFKTGTILTRMLKKQFDQPPLAGTKVPMDASTGQAMQERHGLLREKFFKFFGGHRDAVTRESLFVNRLDRLGHSDFLR